MRSIWKATADPAMHALQLKGIRRSRNACALSIKAPADPAMHALHLKILCGSRNACAPSIKAPANKKIECAPKKHPSQLILKLFRDFTARISGSCSLPIDPNGRACSLMSAKSSRFPFLQPERSFHAGLDRVCRSGYLSKSWGRLVFIAT
jgi:hypothetical protein